MKHLLPIIVLLSLLPCALSVRGAQPYCHARLYDETDGLSQRTVKGIAAGPDGFVWLATWDGLNRYDGYDFRVIRPQTADTVRRYSQRFRAVYVAADSSVWGRVDDRLVRLSMPDYRWEDVHERFEQAIGRTVNVRTWRWNAAGDTVAVSLREGGWYALPAVGPMRPVESRERPKLVYPKRGRREKVGDFAGVRMADQAYGRPDARGRQWMVTHKGRVFYADSAGAPPVMVADLCIADSSLYYCATDLDGGLWFRSKAGAHRLELGTLPYTVLKGGNDGRILDSFIDGGGCLWVAEPERKAIALYPDGPDGDPLYVGPDGRLNRTFVSFGRSVYSLEGDADGSVWAGCKPEGLFHIRPGRDVAHTDDGDVYDILHHPTEGLVGITMGRGIIRPGHGVYDTPRGTERARKAMLCADTLMIVATTGGVLAFDPTAPSERSVLHFTEPGRSESLPCIATTDILQLSDSAWLVATESNGITLMKGDPFGRAVFTQVAPWLRTRNLGMVRSLASLPGSGCVVAAGLSSLFTFDPSAPDGKVVIYGPAYWRGRLRFSDMRPLPLGDGRLLVGTEHGGLLVNLADTLPRSTWMPVYFTSVSLGAAGDSILPPSVERLVLSPSERSLTLRCAAVEFGCPEDIRYSFRLNGGQWSVPAPERTLTLFDLAPGIYTAEVRVTDHMGRLVPGSVRTLTLEVVPRWHETVWAKALMWLVILLAAGGVVWTCLYIRAIKRKQRETLEAYLAMASGNAAPAVSAPAVSAPDPSPRPGTGLDEQDTLFMEAVSSYVTAHIADSEADVEGMAEAVGVSRSNLTRRMKSLMGVSPADFMRRTRLNHAAKLLRETRMAVKEIAYDCGFSDLNYFGKCFKAAHGTTPTAYRKGAEEKE